MKIKIQKLNSSKPQSLNKQLKEYIMNLIRNGKVKPHEKLPSERELGQELGIARQTVRNVISELTHMGMLYRIIGKGTYVSEMRSDHFNLHVIGFTNINAIDGRQLYRTISQKVVNPPEFVSSMLKIDIKDSVVFVEQLMSVRNEPRWIHRSFIPFNIGKMLLDAEIKNSSIINALISICKERPAKSREHLYPGISSQRDSRLLKISTGQSVQIVKGCIYSIDGTQIEAHESIIAGNLFKLDLEFDFDPLTIDELLRIDPEIKKKGHK